MTREEAFSISAMEGRRITHQYFSDDEYMEILPNDRIRFEDSVTCTVEVFLENRQGEEWETGWSLY